MSDVSNREQDLATARELSGMLVRAAERAKADFVAAVVPFDLPVPIARALLVITGPTRMTELAEELGCHASYVTGLADQLEERGLLARVPGDDRRVKLLTLTGDGQALRERVADAVGGANLVSRLLTGEEQAALRPLLERLLAGTETSRTPGGDPSPGGQPPGGCSPGSPDRS